MADDTISLAALRSLLLYHSEAPVPMAEIISEIVELRDLGERYHEIKKIAEGDWCVSCGWPTDPEVCQCGIFMRHHDSEGHSPVAMGCACSSLLTGYTSMKAALDKLRSSYKVARALDQARLSKIAPCSTCGGVPHVSGKVCVCGGANTSFAERDGLRKIIYDMQPVVESAERYCDALDASIQDPTKMNAFDAGIELSDMVDEYRKQVGS